MGTWNVRSLYEAGKLDNLILEMERLNIDILGISEVRWPDSGKCIREDVVMFYSGSNAKGHPNGVAVVIKKELAKKVTNFVPLSDRCILLQIKGNPININIVQVYAPTADKSDSEIEKFYEDIDQITRSIKKQDLNIYLGDFNAKLGEGRVLDIVGDYGLGVRNERGDRLIEFCQDSDLVVANTWFKLPKRRLYTWISPQDKDTNIVRNQIDFILINKRFRNAVKSAKTYPSGDINSDHNPVVANIRIRLKRRPSHNANRKLNLRLLNSDDVVQETSCKLNEEICKIQETSIEETWLGVKKSVQ